MRHQQETSMKTLLQIQASLFSDAGESSRLASRFVSRWQADNPGAEVMVRDLGREPIPHLTAERFQSFLAKPGERTAAQQSVAAFSDDLIAELERADVIVLGLPMYNFGVPSTLKAYFDHVARAGKTFKYGDKGPVGLLTGKKAVIFATRGGLYAGTPLDTQTDYVRGFLGFLGITDVEFVYAEGLNMGDASKGAALEKALTQTHALATRLAPQVSAAA
jgi:FMN-dependent NADH-azoreductase